MIAWILVAVLTLAVLGLVGYAFRVLRDMFRGW